MPPRQQFAGDIQEAEDLFEPLAGLNYPGVMATYGICLTKTREHLFNALRLVEENGKHAELCYEFQTGTSSLVSLLDGMAVFVEKKMRTTPTEGKVYWASPSTFSDQPFSALKAIKARTCEYTIKGGITVNALRNFCKHYQPWLPLPSYGNNGPLDIRFPIDQSTTSGPVLRGLLFPLFNDAREACIVLAGLLMQDITAIEEVQEL